MRRIITGAIISAAMLLLAVPSGAQPLSKKNMQLGTNFWVIGWGGTDARSGGGWNQTFLDEIRPYTCLRFMDWQGTNGSDIVTWEQRGARDGITYEMMVDLCNVTDADAWFCVPHKADDNYIRQLALLCKNNLKAGLKVYVEYSNETWNGAGVFSIQATWCAEKAREKQIADPAMDWIRLGAFYTVYRSVEIFDIFEQVFGSESPQRVRKVICGFVNNSSRTLEMILALRNAKINPKGIKIDAFGIAPYFDSDDGADLDKALVAAGQVRVGDHLKHLREQYNPIVGANARLVGYEGGQHYTNNAHVFAADQRAYAVYRKYLDVVGPFMDLFCHYAHSGSWGSGGAWGAKRHTGQSSADAPKYRALIEWQRDNPYTEPSVSVLNRAAVSRPGFAAGVSAHVYDITGRRIQGQAQAFLPRISPLPNNGFVLRTVVSH